jgi:pimeloyl-ACP methyl ester carboxylesterase
MKIYFFPGLGADSSLAPLHVLPGYEIEWVEWPKGNWSSWDEFIQKILNENRIKPNQIFVGISFGGLVAQRLTEKVSPNKIILIGSLQSAQEISIPLRLLSKILWLVPSFCFEIRLLPKFLIQTCFGINRERDVRLFYKMASRINGSRVKALIHLALSKNHVPKKHYSIFSIHGSKDKIIPSKNRTDAYLIKDGGHLISMTHSEEINKAILSRIEDVRLGK